jgi:hypothetical protein
MRIFYWIILLLTPFASKAQSQELSRPDFQLCLTGGVSFTVMRGDAKVEEGNQWGVGALAGIALSYHIQNRFALKSGLLFDHKTTHQNIEYYYFNETLQSIATDKIKVVRYFDYLTIPLLFKYYLNDSEKRISYFIEGGGYVSFLINQVSTNYSGSVVNVVYDEMNDFDKTDSGLSFSFGGKFKLSKGLSSEVRILNNYGLRNINGIDNKSIIKVNSAYFTVSIFKSI